MYVYAYAYAIELGTQQACHYVPGCGSHSTLILSTSPDEDWVYQYTQSSSDEYPSSSSDEEVAIFY